MKTLLVSLLALLLAAAVSFSQVQPNGPPQGTTTQGVTSLMAGGAHDFTPTGGFGQSVGQPQDLCGYCHRPHVLASGIASPLWARASIVGRSATYGVYASGSMDVTPTPVNNDDNYSSFCLSCHDGSTFLAASEYGPTGTPYSRTWPAAFTTMNLGTLGDSMYAFTDGGFEANAQQSLSHLHPVHFNYAQAQAKDGQLFPAASTGYVWLNSTTTPATATGRLFNGDMECSSCHNPHFKTGIGLQGANSTNNGALCVACHMK